MLFVLLLGGWGYLSLPPNIQADPKCRITCYWRIGLAWCSKNQRASPAGFEIQYVSKGLKAGSLLQIGILAGIPVIQLLLALPSFPSVFSSNEQFYHHIFATAGSETVAQWYQVWDVQPDGWSPPVWPGWAHTTGAFTGLEGEKWDSLHSDSDKMWGVCDLKGWGVHCIGYTTDVCPCRDLVACNSVLEGLWSVGFSWLLWKDTFFVIIMFFVFLSYSIFFVIWDSERVFSVLNDWVQYSHTPNCGFLGKKKISTQFGDAKVLLANIRI